jgi:hypothetical protein
LLVDFLNSVADHKLLPPFNRVDCKFREMSPLEKMGAPQRAQGMSLPPLFMPDTIPALDSFNRKLIGIGSMTSWPL